MKTSYTTLMQSKYYSAAFNGAIFDGPVRLYFAQFHESTALKIYFMMQQKLAAQFAQAKEVSRNCGGNIMLMVYPTKEAFENIFDSTESAYTLENWNNDLVVGLNGPLNDQQLEGFVEDLGQIMMAWRPVESPKSLSPLEMC